MVTQHFRLNVQPFGVTPDVRFLYLGQSHREAIASLLYGIQACRGFTALIAPPGMGKTTVLLHVLSLLGKNARTAFLFQTLCGPEQFLRSLLADLGIDDDGADLSKMHAKLNACLLEESKAGRQVVVVIDEAQNLDEPVLELVRMLSNFETPGKKLMHLVLCGQPQLAEKLASERLTQLRQRISIVARLNPFSSSETHEYIDHRLRIAGAAAGNAIFSRQAYALVAARSGGIPRNINNLCFNAMSLACAMKKPQVDASVVRETITDLDISDLAPAQDPGRQPRTAGTPVLSIPALFSLSPSWRYSMSIAIGLFIALGLLAYNGTPSRSSHDRTAAEPSAASKAIEREDFNNQAVPAKPQMETAVPAALPTEVPTAIPKIRQEVREPISKHKQIVADKSTELNGISPLPETSEVRLLPEDLERLKHAQAPRAPLQGQDSLKNESVDKRDQVPTELTPQRENR